MQEAMHHIFERFDVSLDQKVVLRDLEKIPFQVEFARRKAEVFGKNRDQPFPVWQTEILAQPGTDERDQAVFRPQLTDVFDGDSRFLDSRNVRVIQFLAHCDAALAGCERSVLRFS